MYIDMERPKYTLTKIHTHTHIHTHTSTYTHHAYIHTFMHACMHACRQTFIQVFKHVVSSLPHRESVADREGLKQRHFFALKQANQKDRGERRGKI
mmetsp:Transcript_36133/g.58412  ORF Transcript_36133/g.58412 Transcript_36133/m.58412 type:complete len:96 (+) Transcript_36133:270-557(+)